MVKHQLQGEIATPGLFTIILSPGPVCFLLKSKVKLKQYKFSLDQKVSNTRYYF